MPLALATLCLGQQPAAGQRLDWSQVPILDPGDSPLLEEHPPHLCRRDETGRRYCLFKWRRHEGYYRWIDEARGVVKLRHLAPIQLEHHDEDYFYLRLYDTAEESRRLAQQRKGAPAVEEPETARSYQTEARERDRWTFKPLDRGLPRSGQWRNGFSIADMNGDGILDIVHGPTRKAGSATPVIFIGDGQGSWRVWRAASFPELPYAYGDVASGDLDGDGRMDLVLAAHMTGLMALVQAEPGEFRSWALGLPLRASKTQAPSTERDSVEALPSDEPVSTTGFSSRAVTLGDWNGDGRLDIVALSEGPASPRETVIGGERKWLAEGGKRIYLNLGDGSWEVVVGPGEMLGDEVHLIDLDGDGRRDLLTDSRIVGSTEVLNFHEGESWTTLGLEDAPPRIVIRSVAASDYDGDGRIDLAIALQSHESDGVRLQSVDLYFGLGERRWQRAPLIASQETEGFTALDAGDLDGDGDDDLAVLTAEGALDLWYNEGHGSFVRELSPELRPDTEHRYCSGYDVEIVDLDADGRSEVIASFAGEPGSESFLTGGTERCPAGGRLRVWTIDDSSSATTATKAASARSGPPPRGCFTRDPASLGTASKEPYCTARETLR